MYRDKNATTVSVRSSSWFASAGRDLPLETSDAESHHSATSDDLRQPTELLNVLGQALQSGFIIRALDGSHLALNQVPLVGPVMVDTGVCLRPPGSGDCVRGLLEVLLGLDCVYLRCWNTLCMLC